MKTGFFDLENWREIGATLSRNKTRTFLTAFGIFWGTAMLAMLLGGADGLERMLRKNFEGFASNMAVMFANRRTISYQGFNKGSTWELTTTDIDALRQIPGMEAVAATNSAGTLTVAAGKYSTTASTQGVDQDFQKAFLPTIHSGRFINESDQRQNAKVAVIGINVANKLFPGDNAVGQFINMQGIYYKVVGVASQEAEIQMNGSKIDDNITLPQSTLARSFNMGDGVDGVMIVAAQGHTPKELKPKIMRVVRAAHPIDPVDDQALFFFDVSEQFAMVDSLFMGITLLAFFVGIGTLIAGIIGVGNIMWVIVKERTSEIGIRRSIGAKPIDIVTQILSEGIALTSVAGTAGIVFATAALAVAEQIFNVKFQITFGAAVAIMLIFLALGIAASIIPSLKAMKIKPIEAINDK
ncbi:MAG: ABC transporter permease [Bacteroides sp.]|nr:ABC transporter permease [Bacteroides sp.]MCM1379813.1 ABC transporter permease [Bacteroides sp.]MCM1446172.1 ABC transporter permease [Prevotella sp.]